MKPFAAPDSSTYLPVVAATAVDSDYAKGGDSTSSELRDCQSDDSQLCKKIYDITTFTDLSFVLITDC